MALKRIKEEFEDLIKNPINNIGISVGLNDESNYFEWKCILLGPKDSPYKGGLFFLKISFPEDYPNHGPKVRFITPIYHTLVIPKNDYDNNLGYPCIINLNYWKPTYTMREVLTNIFALFYIHRCDSPFPNEIQKECYDHRNIYYEKIKYFTKKYANPMKFTNYYYYSDWDFSLPNELKLDTQIKDDYKQELYEKYNYIEIYREFQIPRNFKNHEFKNDFPHSKDTRRINFITSFGFNILISIPADKKIKKLISLYIRKLGLDESSFKYSILFIYNGELLDPLDERTIGTVFKNKVCTITVIEKYYIL